jgi:predicted membrane protein
MFDICPPALIYIVFSFTQIIIDSFKGLYNLALVKFIIMLVIGFLLNILCQGGLGVVSWIIVFIPFILMSIVATLILYIFGLKATSGKTKHVHFKKDVREHEDEDEREVEYKKENNDRVTSLEELHPYRHGFSQKN